MVASSLWKVIRATKPSSCRNIGPYGAGALPHSGSTGAVYELLPSSKGPYRYGFMWWLTISPWAAYE